MRILSTSDTYDDIRLIIESKVAVLSPNNAHDRSVLVDKVLGKAGGSFLWTVIVLLELSESYGQKQSSQALEEIPCEMVPFYRRTLELMACTTRGKNAAKAVLVWITCVVLPLTINKLSVALTFDIRNRSLGLEENCFGSPWSVRDDRQAR